MFTIENLIKENFRDNVQNENEEIHIEDQDFRDSIQDEDEDEDNMHENVQNNEEATGLPSQGVVGPKKIYQTKCSEPRSQPETLEREENKLWLTTMKTEFNSLKEN